MATTSLALAASAPVPPSAPPAARYTTGTKSPDGLGKYYFGREIAHYMTHAGAPWLERPEREAEERPDLVLAALQLKPGDTVADIGCGTGYFSWRLASAVGPTGRVYGVEIQLTMLDLLAANMKSHGATNVTGVLGTVADPQLPAPVDLALLVDVYHECSEPWEMIDAICRRLKPGGRIVFVEYRGEDPTVPIKTLHKMTEAQVIKEMTAQPLDYVETVRSLPRQHLIVFRKRATSTDLRANSSAVSTTPLQALVDRAAATALETFKATHLEPSQLAITLIDVRHPTAPQRASYHGEVPIYPASVVKLFYLAAAHRWLEDGRLADTPELRRALRDMIVDSSNDATGYIVDLLTGTTSGPELSDDEIKTWFDRRNAVNRYFAAQGYTDINVSKKPWGDGPYGRETQASRLFEPKRNALTTEATAQLLAEIATGRCVTAAHSAEMMALLSRDPTSPSTDPDNQAKFTGPALPPGAKLWSKAGWTSQTRHDAAYVELPNGAKFVLVIFTTDHANEREIIASIARTVVAGFTESR